MSSSRSSLTGCTSEGNEQLVFASLLSARRLACEWSCVSVSAGWVCCVPRELVCDRVGGARGTPTGTDGGKRTTMIGIRPATWLMKDTVERVNSA